MQKKMDGEAMEVAMLMCGCLWAAAAAVAVLGKTDLATVI
jgi:hypothetical protein